MAITHPLDLVLYRGLSRLHYAYAGLLAVETRQLDELTPAEVALEAQWQAEIEPVLADLYWWPLRNGIEQAPEDEDELEAWLLAAFALAGSVAALLALLRRFQVRGVNIGGRVGLDLLGIGGSFSLTNIDYLNLLDEQADSLTTAGTDLSLIDTTVKDLVRGIPAARQSADNTLLVLGGLIAGWAAVRSVRIAATEESRNFTRGLNWVYLGNEVKLQKFQTREDACPICSPLNGRIMPVDDIPDELRIPKHPRCRCAYLPVTDGWEKPATIWRGE